MNHHVPEANFGNIPNRNSSAVPKSSPVRSKGPPMLRALLFLLCLRLIGLRSMPESEAFAPPHITKRAGV